MKKIVNIALLALLVSFISCSTDENETQVNVFKANIDGQVIDFANTPLLQVTLTDNKRLVIDGRVDGVSLTLTVGEIFLDASIQEGNYKIGTLQDNLETNLSHFNPDDTNVNGTSFSNYIDAYGCNVLSTDQVGEINITELDTENKIVSGNFNGTLFRWIDITTGESKSIEVTDGVFTLPYIDNTSDLNPDRNVISAKVNGFRLVTEDPGSPDSRRSLATGVDKITLIGYDANFGRIQISIPSNVISGNTYSYQPDGSFQSLGIVFQNRINLPEDLLSTNPDQSNDSYITIINHDPVGNMIEGTFYVENSEIMGRTITDGYFKIQYVDDVE